jgi:hypothetical protein
MSKYTGIWHHVCDECGYEKDTNNTAETCPICGSPDIGSVPNKSIGHIEFVKSKYGRFELFTDNDENIIQAPIDNLFNETGRRFGRFVCTSERAAGYLARVWGIVE